MTKTLLYIRTRQIKREADSLGLYLVIFIAIAIILSFVSYIQYQNNQKAWYVVGVLSIICFAIQYNRKDKQFIYKQLDKPHFQIFLEYIILTLPFSITCLFTKNWLCLPVLVSVLTCIPYLKFQFKHTAVFKHLSTLLPASNFEWLSGIRKQFIPFISLYLLALAFCWVRILPLFLLWLLTIIISSFFLENEPVHILREGNKTAKKFLWGKMKINIKYILILYLLPVIINAIFVREFLIITLLFIPVQIALVCFAVNLKYCTYKPQTNQFGNNVAFSIVAMLAAMPYFLPIPVILAIIYFYKAESNLKIYLHD
ncbi:MAG: hypothetical protein IPL54_17150 [Chitinophagaceae bacterium]|nr:hypothetical protein [Chitinophagaceae bacterium]